MYDDDLAGIALPQRLSMAREKIGTKKYPCTYVRLRSRSHAVEHYCTVVQRVES